MKTTNNKDIVATVAVGAFALVALTRMAASFMPVMVIVGSYVAVGILFAFAAVDYRVATKGYSNR
jgi:hypothetical protein